MRIIDTIRHLGAHDDFRKSAANALWLASETSIRVLVAFFVGLWIARYLGPEAYGRFQYAHSWVGLFSAIAWLGTGETVVKDLVRGGSDEGEILGNVLAIRLIGSIVAVSLAVAIGMVVGIDATVSMLVGILCVGVFFANVPGGILIWFQSRTNMRPVVVARSLVILFCAGLNIGLIVGNAPLAAFAWVVVVEAVVLCIALFIIFRRQGKHISNWRFRFQGMMHMLRNGFPIVFSALVASLNMRIDQLMLGWLSDFREVGIYAAATRFSEIWWVIPPILMSSLSPKFIFANDLGERLQRNVVWISAGLLALAVVPSVGTMFAGRPLIGGLLGDKYLEGVPVLIIHIWTAVFIFLDAPAAWYLLATGRQPVLIVKSVGALVINFALNAVLIPRWGAVGAAISTLVASVWIGCVFYMSYPGVRDVFRIQRAAVYQLVWGWWHPRASAS